MLKERISTYTPAQKRANGMINGKIKTGEIIRPTKCVNGHETEKKIQAHHPDPANKPLTVVWCCQRCHKQFEDGLVEVESWMIRDYENLRKRDYSPDGKSHWKYREGKQKAPTSEETRKKMSDSQRKRHERETNKN